MGNVIDFLSGKGELLTGKPVSEVEISNIEEKLGVKFADDYKLIVSTHGFICVDGHEITGITNAKRLNVYDVTIKERENLNCDMSGLYVIEQTHIDNIVLWQSESGMVYQTVGDSKPEKIANSIKEYLR